MCGALADKLFNDLHEQHTIQFIMHSQSNTSLSSLEDFIREAVVQVFSPDDAVSEAALAKFWSPKFQDSEVATGERYGLAGFAGLIRGLRTQLSERTLVKETFVVATPADATNRSAAVGTTHGYSAVQDGRAVTATCVAVLRIKWVPEHGHHHGGRTEVAALASIIDIS
ncbi:hypothetical protein FB451DRAFT_1172670 [Mycena latifolia]|nr:hypothetical protein FB451DRAFT_1172670 [Mycena latifolia]